MNNKRGFTLAEVLITLTIVGVVAALTIPSLIQQSDEAQIRTSTKKAYSTLSNALSRMTQENSGLIWDQTTADDSMAMRDEFIKYLSYSKTDSLNSYFATSYKNYKRAGTLTPAIYAFAGLGDGTGIRFAVTGNQKTCTGSVADYNNTTGLTTICGELLVDSNGKKGPNTIGLDLLMFFVIKTPNGAYVISPLGSHNDGFTCSITASDCNQWGYCGWGCATKLITDQPLP